MIDKRFFISNLRLLIFLFILLSFVQKAFPAGTPSEKYFINWKLFSGDEPKFKEPSYNDTNWESFSVFGVYSNLEISAAKNGVKWLRAPITFAADAGPLKLAVRSLQSAYEVFWDGELIGRNGKVGNTKSAEMIGRFYFQALIDGHLTQRGKHILAIRLSDFHFYSIYGNAFVVYLLDGKEAFNAYYEIYFRSLFSFGVSLTLFLAGLALFFGGGYFKPYLYLSLIPTLSWISNGISFMSYFFNMPNYMAGILQIIYLLFIKGTFLLICLFLLEYFQIPRRFFLFSLIFLFATLPDILYQTAAFSKEAWFDYAELFLLNSIYLLFALYGIVKRKPGRWLVLTANCFYLPLMLGDYSFIALPFVFYELIRQFFFLTLFFTVTVQLRIQNRIQFDLEARSARLETEMLKKAIQPHFLMNTLASLQSWSKRNLEKAEQMTQAIADEYRRINEIMSKKMIPVEEELELCRSHLKLMGFRRDANYELRVESICPHSFVPPLVFHTIVENALTHALRPKEDGLFVFSCIREEGEIRYKLSNNGSSLRRSEAGTEKELEGTGIKYIKSRLEESFPKKWSMNCGLRGEMWVVEIVIRER